MQLLRVARTLTRCPQLPATHILRRPIESKAADDVTAFQQVAHVFQATVEGLTTSHERSLDSQRRDLIEQINALQERLKNAEIALIQNVTTNTYINEGLRTKLEMGRNNLHLRSAVEIITTLPCPKAQRPQSPEFCPGSWRSACNQRRRGGWLQRPQRHIPRRPKKAVVGALTTKSGIKSNDIRRALASLYGELSKHHHTGVSDALTLREGEQTLSEAIGAMSVILFAR
ncbi:hypothetical protein DFH09DRAFT_1203648, partial [Mycena vulgaris]